MRKSQSTTRNKQARFQRQQLLNDTRNFFDLLDKCTPRKPFVKSSFDYSRWR